MNEDIWNLRSVLRRMTITLGNPALQYVVAGEGNTSVKTDDRKRMVIKVSGTTFLNPDFVVVEAEKALQLMLRTYTAAEVSEKLRDMVIGYKGQKPSREVAFHAALGEYKWVVHTHAREIEGFVCSKAAENTERKSQYIKKLEDVSGGSIAWAQFASPGIPLARVVRRTCDRYMEDHGYRPEAIFLQNHGFIVGGDEPRVVEELIGKYVAAVATLRSELSLGVPADEMRFGGQKDINYSKHEEKLSRALLERLKEMGYGNIGYRNSELFRLLVRSRKGREYVLAGNVTIEQLQYLGVRPAWAGYSESMRELAKNVEAALVDYRRRFNSQPKVLYLEGLGILAIGRSDDEVSIVCDVAEKSIDVLMRTIPFGGPRYLTEEQEKAFE